MLGRLTTNSLETLLDAGVFHSSVGKIMGQNNQIRTENTEIADNKRIFGVTYCRLVAPPFLFHFKYINHSSRYLLTPASTTSPQFLFPIHLDCELNLKIVSASADISWQVFFKAKLVSVVLWPVNWSFFVAKSHVCSMRLFHSPTSSSWDPSIYHIPLPRRKAAKAQNSPCRASGDHTFQSHFWNSLV